MFVKEFTRETQEWDYTAVSPCSLERFFYIWQETGYSEWEFEIFLSPIITLTIYEFILARDWLLYPS
jgi:hypothetical protein